MSRPHAVLRCSTPEPVRPDLTEMNVSFTETQNFCNYSTICQYPLDDGSGDYGTGFIASPACEESPAEGGYGGGQVTCLECYSEDTDVSGTLARNTAWEVTGPQCCGTSASCTTSGITTSTDAASGTRTQHQSDFGYNDDGSVYCEDYGITSTVDGNAPYASVQSRINPTTGACEYRWHLYLVGACLDSSGALPTYTLTTDWGPIVNILDGFTFTWNQPCAPFPPGDGGGPDYPATDTVTMTVTFS